MPTDTDIQIILADYDLTLIKCFHAPYSEWVARAEDARGQKYVIKQSGSQAWDRNQGKTAVLLGEVGLGPVTDLLANNLMRMEDLGDSDLGSELDASQSRQYEFGQLLRRVHQLPVASWCESLESHFEQALLPHYKHHEANLSPSARELGQTLLQELGQADQEHCFLHGDAWAPNVCATEAGLRLLDGYGFCGDRAYDLALCAARLSNPGQAAASLLAGYEETPPRFEQWLRWRCLFDYAASTPNPSPDPASQLAFALGV